MDSKRPKLALDNNGKIHENLRSKSKQSRLTMQKHSIIVKRLSRFGAVPFSSAILGAELGSYSSIADKSAALVSDGTLVRIRRGLFCVSPEVSGQRLACGLVANHLYGPSYVSLEWALARYGMIPERVAVVGSVCMKRAKSFVTPLGRFEYHKVPAAHFVHGFTSVQDENGNFLMMATPAKALCDLVMLRPNLRMNSREAMRAFLFDDMRLSLDHDRKIDLSVVRDCITTGRKARLLEWLGEVIEDEAV